MFDLSQLEIALITFNRDKCLKTTLDCVLGEDSPVRACSVVVYDNHSEDATPALLAEYAHRYPNLKAVSNRRNLGLSGNICKALENSSKKYIWILCDNDQIDWSQWPGVLKGLEKEHDIVLASRFYIQHAASATPGLKLAQLTFLPSGIYKTENLTDEVMAWTMNDTYTVLPHLVLACAVVNKGADIYVPQGSVVTIADNPEMHASSAWEGTESLDRIAKASAKKHPKASGFCFEACEMNACSFLNNLTHRRELLEAFAQPEKLNGWGPFFKYRRAIRWYFEGKNSFSNLMDVYPALSAAEKISFWFYFAAAGLLYKLGLKRR